MRGVAGVSPCERRFRKVSDVCLHLDRVLSPLPLHARHSTGDTTHTTNGSTGTVTNLTRPSPRPARDDARPRRRAIYDNNLIYDILRHISLSVKLQRHTHVRCRITRREMRDPCVAVRFASGAHITRASRRQAGPPNPLVAARLHGSAPHARSASPHANTSNTLLYLFGSRSPGTRHAC